MPPTDLPPPQARTVTVGADRLARWLSGFTERHGATDAALATSAADVVTLAGADGARAWLEVPFGPLATDDADDPLTALVAHVTRPRLVGVVLVRRAGHAAGLFYGATLVRSKVDSTYVQGTTKAGGWSQQRYARRRANQAGQAFARAADHAVTVLGDARPEVLVAGGDREAVRAVLSDPRLAHLPEPTAPWLAVPDPKLKVLAGTPDQFRAVRVRLIP